MNGITLEQLQKFKKNYAKRPINNIVENALAYTKITDVIKTNESKVYNQPNFEINIKTMSVTDQKSSGRCWIFAGLNLFREVVAKKCNIDKFELSQNYVAFYDKLEKINYLLESIIELCDRDYDDRTLSHILKEGIQDGGQWDMLVNVIKKYGLVPKHAMDETHQSSNTRSMNYVIDTMACKFAAHASKFAKENKYDEIRKEKEELLEKLYAFLCMGFGKPIEKFDFEYTDKDGNYHLDQGLTPLSFYQKYVGEALDDYVSIINAPTFNKPFYEHFTVNYVGNVIDGKKISYINLPMNEFKEICVNQLKKKELIWFGSDCGKFGDGKVWDDKQFDYKNTFDLDLDVEKGDMLNYQISAMNHAMLLTGISFKDGKVGKWKIENSWGDKSGFDGYYLASDSWFDKFVFQAVVNKKYLTKEQLAVLDKKQIELDPWDPMGTLAD